MTRFERELEALRKELAEAAAGRSGIVTPADNHGLSVHSRAVSEDNLSLTTESPVYIPQELPNSEVTTTPISGLTSAMASEQSISSTPEPKKDR